MSVEVIVSFSDIDGKYGIAKEGEIPWYVGKDVKYFRTVTENHYLLMNEAFYRAKGNYSSGMKIVISDAMGDEARKVRYVAVNMTDALDFYFRDRDEGEKLFICGGSKIYEEFIAGHAEYFTKLHLIQIDEEYPCDEFFPLYQHLDIVKERLMEAKAILKTDKLTITTYGNG